MARRGLRELVADAAVQGEMALLERALYLAGSAMFVGVPLGCLMNYVVQWCLKRTLTAMRERIVLVRISTWPGFETP